MVEVKVLTCDERVSLVPLLKKTFSSFPERVFLEVKDSEQTFSVGAFVDGVLVGHIFVHEGFDYYQRVRFYTLDYVVVKEEYRGRGIAKKMLKLVEKVAKKRSMMYLRLTSNSTRVAARKVYADFGFSCHDTGVFEKKVGVKCQ